MRDQKRGKMRGSYLQRLIATATHDDRHEATNESDSRTKLYSTARV